MEKEAVQTSRDVASRWTPLLAAGGFTPVANKFLKGYHLLGLKYGEAMLVIHLIEHKWEQKMPFPSARILAERMGISEVSVRVIIRRVEAGKLIKRIKKVGRPVHFDLAPLFDALEQLDVGGVGRGRRGSKKRKLLGDGATEVLEGEEVRIVWASLGKPSGSDEDMKQ